MTAQGQSKPGIRTIDAQGVAAFRLLGENKKIEDYFEFGEQIYVDSKGTGKVLNAKRKVVKNGECQECVVKVRVKKGLMREEEVAWRTAMTCLLASKCCPNVLQIQEIFEDEKACYIVMAKCSGGELFDFLLHEVDVPLEECKRIIREILLSLKDLHSIGLIHRDVKPENIMFDKPGKTLKLIDFDTCVPWNPNPRTNKPQRFHGTPGYIAPEVLVDRASPQSDLFGVGVIIFVLMTGEMPWSQDLPKIHDPQVDGTNAREVHEALRNERIPWNESAWPYFPCAAHLCQQLMAFDPIDRMTSATEALNHPWLQTKMR
jgi:serine/threonine protein kinase